MKALAFIMLFMFSMGSMFAQSVERSTFYNRCMSEAPPGPSEADVANLYLNQCGDTPATVVKTTYWDPESTDCSWFVEYAYTIECGDFQEAIKVEYTGGDQTAPVLEGELPTDQADLNLCYDAIPEGPSISDIAALYSDNCSDVIVEKSGTPEGSDCSWSVTYKYTVRDACFNYADEVTISYSGGDTEAPTLKKKAIVPTGEFGLNLCLENKAEGPSEAEIAELFQDNCSSVITVVKTASSKGSNCKWKAEYTYVAYDECNNASTPISIMYGGGDTEAPELVGVPEDVSVDCIDEIPSAPVVTATDNCGISGKVKMYQDNSGLGIACEGGVVVRTWNVTDDCGNLTSATQTITVGAAPAAEFSELPQDMTISCAEAEVLEVPSLYYSNGVEAGACAIYGEAPGVLSGEFTKCGGELKITWSFEDECGRSILHVQNITVEETPMAEFLEYPETIYVDCMVAEGLLSETPNLAYSNGLEGDCGINGEAEGILSGGFDECGGSLKLTWSYTDECDRNITHVQDIKVNPAPEAVFDEINDYTISCEDLSTFAPANLPYSNGIISTNCGINGEAVGTYEPFEGSCGSFEVNYTFTDDCDRTISKTITVTVEDLVAPVVTEAMDMTVECDGEGNVAALQAWLASNGGATATDNCGNITWSNNFEALSDLCGATGSATVEFTAYDDCQNSTKTTATFTIEDTVPPVLTDAMDMTVDCDGQGNVEALEAWLSSNGGATASDACSGVTWSNNFEGLSDLCGATGAATVEFTATDECGNSSKTTATFTIRDIDSPPITNEAQDLTVECDGEGNVEALEAWLSSNGGAEAYDICSSISWSNNFDGLSDLCGATGSATVLFTVVDECGNSSSTEATFTIEDTTPPALTEAEDMTVECDGEGNTDALEAWLSSNGGATASDECSGVTWSNNFDGLSDLCGATGSATVEFTATDACGLVSKTTATFTIEDTINPSIDNAAENMTVECDGAGNVEALEAWLASNGGAEASDACSGVTWSNDFVALSDDCGATGSALVVFIASDECGNTSKTSATFTIEDTTAPEITEAEDMTVECDGEGNLEQLEAWLLSNGGATASDVCSSVSWYNNFCDYNGDDNRGQNEPNCVSLSDLCGATGSVTVTFTAYDECNNESKTTATFTIEDTIAPVIDIEAKDMVVECDGEGNLEQLEAWLASNGGATASDECSDVTWSNNFEALSDLCGATGSATVEFTVYDECENSSKTTATFTIEDTTAPDITPSSDMTVECGPGGDASCEYSVVLYDSYPDGWNGNALSIYVDGSLVLDGITLDDGGESAPFVFSVSNGSIISAIFDDSGSYDYETSYTIFDADSNEVASGSETDVEELVAVCSGEGSLGSYDQYLAWLANNGGATASDTCGEVTWSNNASGLSDGCGETGSETVEFTATDACGNISKTTSTFTIIDTTAPEVEDAQDMTVECDGEGNADELAAWLANNGGATATDLCSDVTWSNNFDALSDLCGATGAATVEFTATDECGNATKTTATFTIEDTTAPNFTFVPEDVVLECDQPAPDPSATAEDGCGDVVVSHIDYYTNTPWQAYVEGNGTVDLTNTPDGFTVVGSNTGTFTGPWLNVGFTTVKNVLLSFDYEYTNNDSYGGGYDDLVVLINGEIAGTLEDSGVGSVTDLELTAGDQFAIGILNPTDDCCGSGTVVVSNINFEINNQCPITECFIRQYTATDDCGNTTTADQYVIFQDTTAPVIDPQAEDMTVECDGEGNIEALNAWLESNGGASATDNCSEFTWSNDFEALSDECGATGSATVTFTATDACGNASSTSATFTIVDTTAPTVVEAQDMTVECDGEGNVAQLAAWIASNGGATATDECSEVTWTNSCAGQGQGELEFVGSFDTHAGLDWVDYPDQPVYTGQEAAALLFGGSPSDYVISTSSDANNITNSNWASTLGIGCDVVAHDFSKDTNGGGYTNPMPWVTDTATSAYVHDNCTQNNHINYVYRVNGQGLCELSDGCGATGSVTVEFTATDECGNATKTTATFTVEDTVAPTIDVEAKDMIVECDGEGNVEELEAWLESYGGAAASDECSGVTWSNNFDALSDLCGATGAATVEFTATDECGNSSKTTATFTIEDTIAPTIDVVAEDMTVECDGLGNVDALNAWLADNGGAEASDECSGVVWTNNFVELSDECAETGSATVEFTATDDCGNSSKTTATFTIEDTTAPVMVGPYPQGESNLDLCYENRPLGPTEAEIAALFDEACGEVVVTKTEVDLGDDCDWAVMYRYEIADECGNVTNPVKVYYNGSDQSAPVLEGELPVGVTGLQCLTENPGGPKASDLEGLYTDNCGNVTVTALEPVIEGDDCGWTATYTYTVEDACGNYADNIVIINSGADTEAPVLDGVIPFGQNTLDLCIDADLGEPSEEDIAELYYDNCGGAVTVTKIEKTYGTDCEWIRVFEYVAMDACGNKADIVKVNYQGGDTSAPVPTQYCSDETMVLYTSNGAECPSNVTTSLNIGDEIGTDTDWSIGGMSLSDMNGSLVPCFTDNCTAVEDLTYYVADLVVDNDNSCSAKVIITFDVSDNCGNTYEGFVCTFVILDDEAPVVECPADQDFGLNPSLDVNGLPVGLADKAPYTDNCQESGQTQVYTDVVTEENAGGGSDFIQFVTDGWYIDYTLSGYDSDGYPTYSGVFNWPSLGIYGNSLSYPLAYNHDLGRWEGYENYTLLYSNTTTSSTPSCELSNWVDCGCLTATPQYIECSNGQGSSTEYTLVRTFTADDGCGNVGECSVTYTWTESSNANPPANPQTNEENAALYTATSTPDEGARVTEEALDFTAYPVPFDKVVNIAYSFDFDTDVTIELYDTKGLLVLSETNANYVRGSKDKTTFDLSRTANQMFYVKLTTSQGTVTKKIVSSSPNRR